MDGMWKPKSCLFQYSRTVTEKRIQAALALREFLEDIAQEPYFEKRTENVSKFAYPE